MSMTTEQAMKHFASHMKADADCYNMAAAKGYMSAAAVHKRDFEANKIAITALREKAEREDPKPLTLEELRQMDGEPVWIWNKSQKPTCVLCVFGQFQQEPLFVNFDFVKEDSTHIVKYDRIKKWGYRFYRHRPKEVT